jgi:hypothetical protein
MNDSNLAQGSAAPRRPSVKESFLLRKLPYALVLALTILGVAYTAMWRQPLIGYWEFVALVTGVVCVSSGWPVVEGRQAHVRLMWTQGVHWAAILIAMNIVLLPGVQSMLTAPATGLALLLLLALGTFLAGIHVSFHICVLGLVMALLVPAIAWLKQSALFLALATASVIGLALIFWWHGKDESSTRVSRR